MYKILFSRGVGLGARYGSCWAAFYGVTAAHASLRQSSGCQTVSPVNAAVTGGCASGDFLLQRFAQDGQKEHESGPQTDKVREIYT